MNGYAKWVRVMHGKKQVWFDILANSPMGATKPLADDDELGHYLVER